jgi:hypothetical protein
MQLFYPHPSFIELVHQYLYPAVLKVDGFATMFSLPTLQMNYFEDFTFRII